MSSHRETYVTFIILLINNEEKQYFLKRYTYTLTHFKLRLRRRYKLCKMYLSV